MMSNLPPSSAARLRQAGFSLVELMVAITIALFIALGFTLKMLMPLVFARLTEILPMRKAMPAVAFVSGVGNLIGQFLGPLMVGYVRSISSDYKLSLLALGVSALLGGIAIALSKTKAERAAQRGERQVLPGERISR